MDFFVTLSPSLPLPLSLSLSLSLSVRCEWTQFRRIKRGELLNSSAGKRRLQSRLKQGIAARLLSPSVPFPSAPSPLGPFPSYSRSRLAHKRKKIVKRAERLFPHSYSFGVAQQCNWLTTLPYVLHWIPYRFPPPLIAPLLSKTFVFTLVFTQIRGRTRACVRKTVLLSAHLSASVSS